MGVLEVLRGYWRAFSRLFYATVLLVEALMYCDAVLRSSVEGDWTNTAATTRVYTPQPSHSDALALRFSLFLPLLRRPS